MAQIEQRPMSWFRANPQVRKSFEEAELRLLGESLKKKQIHPLIAKPDGTIIDGERRWRAAPLGGVESLDVIIAEGDLNSEQIAEIQLITAIHRADLTIQEKAQGCLQLLRLHPEWKGKELAKQLSLDPSMVTRLLSPWRCIEACQKAFIDGRIGLTDCYAMSRVEPEQQAEMLALKLNGANRDALEDHARKKRSGNNGVKVKVSRLKIPLGQAVVTVSGKNLSLEDAIQTLAEVLKEAKRAAGENLDGKTFQAVMRDKAAKKSAPVSQA